MSDPPPVGDCKFKASGYSLNALGFGSRPTMNQIRQWLPTTSL